VLNDKVTLYPLCAEARSVESWKALRAYYNDLEIKPLLAASPIDAIRQVVGCEEHPFLVCRGGVWIGRGISTQIERLTEELNARFPGWGLCGNRGVRWDGQHKYDFSYDMKAAGLQTAVCAHPVICLDDHILLVNPAALKRHTILAPSLERRSAGILLSLECLLNGTVMAVSPRLMAMRERPADGTELDKLSASDSFRAFYRANFFNHQYPTPEGILECGEMVDYSYVSQPWKEPQQHDVTVLFDAALQSARGNRKPSLTICCRTQFRRPELLRRAVLSFAAFRHYAGELMDVRATIITDVWGDVVEREVDDLKRSYPAGELGCWRHQIRSGRYSRTDLLLAAIELATSDYIWFIDDDDYVNAPAAPAIGRALEGGQPLVIVTSSAVVQETWRYPEWATPPVAGAERGSELVQTRRSRPYRSADVFKCLGGVNFIPVCSILFPLELMKARISDVKALGDYNEDYFLLLLALTAPRVELCLLDCESASISIRGGENTAKKNARDWNLSLATFLLEVLNRPEGNSPFLWQVANVPRW
jgi:hypothetical protein